MDAKSKQLGMNFSTAQHRLRKLIMFNLVKQCNLDTCYRCGKKIVLLGDLSIDHKKAWLHDDINLFWDLDNVAFSHLSCNSIHGKKTGSLGRPSPHRKVGPVGTAWCFRCQSFLSINEFNKDKSRWNGVDNQCRKCRHEYK